MASSDERRSSNTLATSGRFWSQRSSARRNIRRCQDCLACANGSCQAETNTLVEEARAKGDETTKMFTQGDLGKVDITTGTLMACSAGWCFSGGSLDITDTSGATLFDGAFTSGTITQSGGNTFLNASTANGGTVLIKSMSGAFSSDSIITTTTTTVPEPATLGLVGSGVIGLACMRRLARAEN